MNGKKPRVSFFIIFTLFFILPISNIFAKPEKYKFYPIGKIPLEKIFEMNDHTESLYFWMSVFLDKEIPAGVTVIHIDTHTDDSCSKANNLQKAKSLLNEFKSLPKELRKQGFDNLVKKSDIDIGIDSFIIPAMRMGIINKFIWLESNFNFFIHGPWRKQAFFTYLLTKEHLDSIAYCDCKEDLDSCSISLFETEGYQKVNQPVLLDIDMDAFGDQATTDFCSLYFTSSQIKSMIDNLIDILHKHYPNVYMVTIADSEDYFSTKDALDKKAYLKQRLSGSK